MGCTSCAREILSAGRNTMLGIPAAAQYALSAADVSPVLAHPTACTASGFIFLSLFTWLTSTVIPRSLNDPVCEFPHCFTHRSVIPSSFPNRSAQNKFEFPSNILTISSSPSCGSTNSFLLHTPDPCGHFVVPTRESSRFFQYLAS